MSLMLAPRADGSTTEGTGKGDDKNATCLLPTATHRTFEARAIGPVKYNTIHFWKLLGTHYRRRPWGHELKTQ